MLISSLLFGGAAALAQSAVDPVEVTASRWPRTVATQAASISVIERAEIERSGATDLFDLLRTQAGVDLARTGGPGSSTSLFLRGSNSNQVLFLIDGVRVSSVNTGAYAFELLSLDSVERIEIVRGPRAAAWGSDAIGGVVQVFTRAPRSAELALRAARYDDAQISAAYGLGDAERGLGLRLSRRDVGGYSAQTPEGFSYDPDRDGFEREHLGLDASWRLNADWQLRASAERRLGEVAFDRGESEIDQDHARISAEQDGSAAYAQRLQWTYATESLRTPAFLQGFDSRRRGLDWLLRADFDSRWDAQLGLSYLDERGGNRLLGIAPVYRASRQQRAAFVQVGGDFDAHRLEAAWRHEDWSTVSPEASGQFAWHWQTSAAFRVYAQWGQGYRAPNFNELYSPGFDGLFAGNPALSPERSHSTEVGSEWQSESFGTWQARVYRNRVRDLIDFSGPLFQARNIRRSRQEGLELEWQQQIGAWQWSGNFSLQDPRNLDSGERLLRRPVRKAALEAERQIGVWDFVLRAQAVSERAEFGGELAAYQLLDLRLGRDLGEAWHLDLGVDNLLDEDYQLARGFATAGRSWRIGLRWRAPVAD